MSLELKLDSNKVFHKRFEGNKPGYNSLQVDTFLDVVIKDYEAVEKYVKETEEELDRLKKLNKSLQDKVSKAETDAAILSEKMKDFQKNKNASMDNLELLKRIGALEQALYRAGINPNTIK